LLNLRNSIAERELKMLTSHVTANLDQWVENGFITTEQRDAVEQLMENALQDAYEAGLLDTDDGYDDGYDAGVDSGYDSGWDAGYEQAKKELRDELRDEWFEQGWAEALAEHGIEE
jgi:flagellar biosynthesis/type III secretory pathway protein FliH